MLIKEKGKKVGNNTLCVLFLKNEINIKIKKGFLKGYGHEGNCYFTYRAKKYKEKTIDSRDGKTLILLYRIICTVNNETFTWDMLYENKAE